ARGGIQRVARLRRRAGSEPAPLFLLKTRSTRFSILTTPAFEKPSVLAVAVAVGYGVVTRKGLAVIRIDPTPRPVSPHQRGGLSLGLFGRRGSTPGALYAAERSSSVRTNIG